MSEPHDFSIPLDPGAQGDLGARLTTSMESRKKSALAMYRVHRAASVLAQYRLLTYRCAGRGQCLLLDVFRTPAGPAVYFPPFKLSPAHNAVTDEDARVERTSDGQRRWVERADMLAPLERFRGLPLHLNCDHVSRFELLPGEIREALTTHRVGDVIHVVSRSDVR